jgi:hypothetical protein
MLAIVSQVAEAEIELVQQNPGPFGASREQIGLAQQDGKWHLEQRRVLGWL